MKKHLLLSILFGLSLTMATPAQAAWYDWIPGSSWFINKQAQTKPAQQPDIENQQPHVKLSTSQVSWFSTIFRNPLASFYTFFSAWLNKAKIMSPSTRAQIQQLQQEIGQLKNQADKNDQELQELFEEPDDELTKKITQINILENKAQSLDPQNRTGWRNINLPSHLKVDRTSADNDVKNNVPQTELDQLQNKRDELKSLITIDALEKNRLLERHIRANTRLAFLQNIIERERQINNDPQPRQNLQIIREPIEPISPSDLNNSVTGPSHLIEREKDQLENSITGPSQLIEGTGQLPQITATLIAPQAAASNSNQVAITKHLQLDPVSTSVRINNGKAYAKKLLTGQGAEIPTRTQVEYLDSIVALNWFLYGHALNNQQGFTEGTFVIEDIGFKLYNFFLKYITTYNPTMKGDKRDPLAHYSTNPWGYSRDASHFVHMKKEYRPYGIDMRYENKNFYLGHTGELPLLPAYKRHMLFGQADPKTQRIYVKPENHGLYYADGELGHIWEFISAQARKQTWFGWVAQGILSLLGYSLSSDDSDLSRKERPTIEFLQKFAEYVKNPELLKQAKRDGFKILFSTEMIKAHNEGLVSAGFEELVNQYRQQYDNIEHRTGREIQITHQDLLKMIE